MSNFTIPTALPQKNIRGFALMLVLSLLILLGLLGSSFSIQVQVETRSTAWLAEQTRLQSAAQAGIFYGFMQATLRNKTQRWRLNNQPYAFDWQGYRITIYLLSEQGRIDLNVAPRSLLVGLFKSVFPNTAAESLADAVIDWRDADDRTRQGRSEIAIYHQAGRHYVPTNSPFTQVAELADVLGFDQDSVAKLRPYLTVHSRRARIDATTADVAVIAALPGIHLGLAEQFVTHRERALTNGQSIDFSFLSTAKNLFDTQAFSQVIAIQVQLQSAGENVYRAEAVIRAPSNKMDYQILHWQTLELE